MFCHRKSSICLLINVGLIGYRPLKLLNNAYLLYTGEVTNIETDVDARTVLVTTTLTSDIILEQLIKTNLETSYVGTV